MVNPELILSKMKRHNFRKLKIWKKAINLATVIYEVTQHYPKEEMYGIVSQMRRSSVSISSNIAEGAGRKSRKEFSQFLRIAYASLCELETQLIISKNLHFITNEVFLNFLRRTTKSRKWSMFSKKIFSSKCLKSQISLSDSGINVSKYLTYLGGISNGRSPGMGGNLGDCTSGCSGLRSGFH